jgi:hypothetical protein
MINICVYHYFKPPVLFEEQQINPRAISKLESVVTARSGEGIALDYFTWEMRRGLRSRHVHSHENFHKNGITFHSSIIYTNLFIYKTCFLREYGFY